MCFRDALFDNATLNDLALELEGATWANVVFRHGGGRLRLKLGPNKETHVRVSRSRKSIPKFSDVPELAMAVLSSPIVLIQSVPIVTRSFTAATILASALYAYLRWKNLAAESAPYLTLIPGHAIYAPWTLFTSALVETTILEVRSSHL